MHRLIVPLLGHELEHLYDLALEIHKSGNTLKPDTDPEGPGGLPGNAQGVPRMCPGKNARALLPGHFLPYWSRSGVEERESRRERLVMTQAF